MLKVFLNRKSLHWRSSVLPCCFSPDQPGRRKESNTHTPEEEREHKAPIREETTDFFVGPDRGRFRLSANCFPAKCASIVLPIRFQETGGRRCPPGGEYKPTPMRRSRMICPKELDGHRPETCRSGSAKRVRYRAPRPQGSGFITSAPLIPAAPEATALAAEEADQCDCRDPDDPVCARGKTPGDARPHYQTNIGRPRIVQRSCSARS